ncbi:hypothetical protein BN874_1640002 [Candidatus Contendobacter odensis Run_B_J11]|uniref:Uncharacterized protein n=1 Tax=Candidatus Contendobacter odensis Run_B_J11 TaxID=1400861 RepID=A0A7U7J3P7_9GAMM|nr:hypothetical protein BN874_1640002 [Candidatus Contendobacter odensis Run_B_J11]
MVSFEVRGPWPRFPKRRRVAALLQSVVFQRPTSQFRQSVAIFDKPSPREVISLVSFATSVAA